MLNLCEALKWSMVCYADADEMVDTKVTGGTNLWFLRCPGRQIKFGEGEDKLLERDCLFHTVLYEEHGTDNDVDDRVGRAWSDGHGGCAGRAPACTAQWLWHIMDTTYGGL